MHCPKCLSMKKTKSGFVKGAQRWRCMDCGCHYTRSSKHGYDEATKLKALQMYREGIGFRRIGRLLGVSNVSVLNWIREFGKRLKEHIAKTPIDHSDVETVIMDEVWHFTQKNKENYGYGWLMLHPNDPSLPMKLALVHINGDTDYGTQQKQDAQT